MPRRYYRPENLGPEQDERDAAIRGRKYFVYVLHTDYGYYVGHSGRLKGRMREHEDGGVSSTAGANPERIWTSRPLATRKEAAAFEAALRSLNNQASPQFTEYTGRKPMPYSRRAPVTAGDGCLVPILLTVAVAALVIGLVFGI